ncbi:IS3 family transposase [Salmonella enterica subsp. enterica serovar Typhimurium]|nr:IS3 family transposase [Salmonella enterica subsp. enterica serovar Typhimurium]EEN7756512.1 IS3 family transposase [Salmonella enterica subsp. enterica serovar Typhimurium]
MNKKTKYSLEFRLNVVKFYLSGQGGMTVTSKHFNVHKSIVSQWVAAYQKHGVDGITWKNDNHDFDFKLAVVRIIMTEGLSSREAASRFNISDPSVVRRWLKTYEKSGEDGLRKLKRGNPSTKPASIPGPPTTRTKPVETLSQDALLAEVRYLRAEVDYLKKPESLSSKREKTKVINELRQFHALNDLLKAAKMPRSTWYHNLNALNREDKYHHIKQKIKEIYTHNKGRYGYRRITLSLRKQGIAINHKTVQRLMSELSLKALIRAKKYRSWKGEVGKIAPNVLQRDFNAQKIKEKWVTDVTEFSIEGEKLYLSPILDLFNGEVIAYNISERPTMDLINGMLEKALSTLGANDSPILHSDQGWQYQMRSYQTKLKSYGIVQSMSRRGNCLDNAVAESFFGTLKAECFYLSSYKNIRELKRAIEAYIHYYNNERVSLKLKGLSPVEYRTQPHLAA